jgi:tetratricopeptide (TPR) repeat protein
LGNLYYRSYTDGKTEVIFSLREGEANFLQARRLALENGWWGPVARAMQGLSVLYTYTGRWFEWKRLVEEVVLAFVEPGTEAPLPGREEDWSVVMNYRVVLARKERNLGEAERLQVLTVDWDRRRAAPLLTQPLEGLNGRIRCLAASLHGLGLIQMKAGRAECVIAFKEALELDERNRDQSGVATCAFNLGQAYMDLAVLRDLTEAERWCLHSLGLRDPGDRLGRGRCIGQLGIVAMERFHDARAAGRPDEELLVFLNDAARWYHKALELMPEGAIEDVAVGHSQLARVYFEAGDFDRALPHCQKAIRYRESQGNLFEAALTRRNVALGLASSDRCHDALAYAEEALRGFKTYGERAAVEVTKTQKLIEWIQELLQGPAQSRAGRRGSSS